MQLSFRFTDCTGNGVDTLPGSLPPIQQHSSLTSEAWLEFKAACGCLLSLWSVSQ